MESEHIQYMFCTNYSGIARIFQRRLKDLKELQLRIHASQVKFGVITETGKENLTILRKNGSEKA